MLALVPAVSGSVAVAATSHANAKPGDMLDDANGARLAPVDQVDDDGAVEIIIDGRVVVVPADTLSKVNGHLMTSLKKPQIIAQQ